jgi:hypothetical protein
MASLGSSREVAQDCGVSFVNCFYLVTLIIGQNFCAICATPNQTGPKAFEDVEQDVIRERADRIFILVLLNKPLARMTSEYNCSIVSERQGEGSARGLGTNVFSSDIGVCFHVQSTEVSVSNFQ